MYLYMLHIARICTCPQTILKFRPRHGTGCSDVGTSGTCICCMSSASSKEYRNPRMSPTAEGLWTWAVRSKFLKNVKKKIDYIPLKTFLTQYQLTYILSPNFILSNFGLFWWLGSVAGPVIEANARPELEDGLRTGALLYFVLRWISVRTKLGVNMGNLGEPELTRLSKYVGIGPDPKGGSSNYKRLAVVG